MRESIYLMGCVLLAAQFPTKQLNSHEKEVLHDLLRDKY
jgi:hypothetical protein